MGSEAYDYEFLLAPVVAKPLISRMDICFAQKSLTSKILTLCPWGPFQDAISVTGFKIMDTGRPTEVRLILNSDFNGSTVDTGSLISFDESFPWQTMTLYGGILFFYFPFKIGLLRCSIQST